MQNQTQTQTQSQTHYQLYVKYGIYEMTTPYSLGFFGGNLLLENLPADFDTELSVMFLVDTFLKIGKASHVIFTEKGAEVYFDLWYPYTCNFDLQNKLTFVQSNDMYKHVAIIPEGQTPFYILKDGSFLNNLIVSFLVPSPKKLEIPEGEWTSLYVPLFPIDMILYGVDFKPQDLQDFIENKIQIGKVRRIDFVDRDDLLNFTEENPLQAAFIHMECWYDNYNAHMLRNALNTKGEMRQRGYHNGEQMIKFCGKVSQGNTYSRYFVFKINHKPIPDADGKLNIHQLAALKTKHEAELEEAHSEIERLKAELNLLKPKPDADINDQYKLVSESASYDGTSCAVCDVLSYDSSVEDKIYNSFSKSSRL